MIVQFDVKHQQQCSVIEQRIEHALEWHAERIVRPTMTIYDGIVTLTGTCHSWAQKDALVAIVRGTQGFHLVNDRLRVDAD